MSVELPTQLGPVVGRMSNTRRDLKFRNRLVTFVVVIFIAVSALFDVLTFVYVHNSVTDTKAVAQHVQTIKIETCLLEVVIGGSKSCAREFLPTKP